MKLCPMKRAGSSSDLLGASSAGNNRDNRRSARKPATAGKVHDPVHHLSGVHPVQDNPMSPVEIRDERGQLWCGLGITAEMISQFDIPAASIAASRLSLQPGNLAGKKAAVLEHRETDRAAPRPQPQ